MRVQFFQELTLVSPASFLRFPATSGKPGPDAMRLVRSLQLLVLPFICACGESNDSNPRIPAAERIQAEPELVAAWDSAIVLSGPTDLHDGVILGDGTVVALDRHQRSLHVFDPAGRLTRSLGGQGSARASFGILRI